ncbi:ankyrin repeat domain-containing protein [Roseiconus lacunae]|uniref:ankyrin repeat domain-containing protein n=1 Tax=Roseiconus lacunae TaxID=2605694 RepID=UPI001E319353|nr:ankyrin repeat domain-containing protein [Roseiconus lacunae]MCD0459592.1 ankyrin repeat domain-containing protein [Roseiconus lacunae]
MFRFIALTVVFFLAFAAAIVFYFSKPAGAPTDGGEDSVATVAADQAGTSVSEPDGKAATDSADSDPKKTTLSYTPEAFRKAALEGKLELVKTCVEEGMDVNESDPQGRTPLAMAAYNGHEKVCRYLIDAGAEVNVLDREGRGPLYHASSLEAPKTVSLLLDAGAEINSVDKVEQFTALMVAAAEGNLEVAKVLLRKGADPTMKDIDGDTALDFAQEKGKPELVQLLSEASAN